MTKHVLTSHRSEYGIYPIWEWYVCSCGWRGSRFTAFLSDSQICALAAPDLIHRELREHLRK
jgi:hypothetical protein